MPDLTRLVFMGTPAHVVPVLHRMHALDGVEVVAAVTPPDRARGRGRQPEAPPVKEAAESLGIPVLQPASLRGESVQSELAALAPDVILVAAYGRFLPPPVLELPRHGCLNLHPSMLPRHRGPSPVATSILDGDASTGVSLMLLDEGMDTGPIIAAREVTLEGTETQDELTSRLFELGGRLLQDNLGPWIGGDLDARPQGDALATVTRKLERTDGLVDWNEPADLLARKCRAFDPWPGLHTEWQGRTLKLLQVTAASGPANQAAQAGQVLSPDSGSSPLVATGAGALSLDRVQLEGRRAVSGEEFLRGHREVIGARLGSLGSGKEVEQ